MERFEVRLGQLITRDYHVIKVSHSGFNGVTFVNSALYESLIKNVALSIVFESKLKWIDRARFFYRSVVEAELDLFCRSSGCGHASKWPCRVPPRRGHRPVTTT